jgi:hypothetical protein
VYLRDKESNKGMGLRRQLLSTILLWVFLIILLGLTTPNRLPVVLLIAPFVLLFLACYSSWVLMQQTKDHFAGHSSRSHRRLGLAVCTSVVLFLVLQSLGQLTLRDVITVAAIVFLGYVYIGRISVGLQKE